MIKDRYNLVCEIGRVEMALQDTDSWKLKHDYGKYLKKLYRELRYYDKAMRDYGKRTESTQERR